MLTVVGYDEDRARVSSWKISEIESQSKSKSERTSPIEWPYHHVDDNSGRYSNLDRGYCPPFPTPIMESL